MIRMEELRDNENVEKFLWKFLLISCEGDLCFLLGTVIVMAVPAVPAPPFDCGRLQQDILFDVILSPLIWMIMFSLASGKGILAMVLRTRFISYLGRLSFGIYLFSS